jgi:hypothetical protein
MLTDTTTSDRMPSDERIREMGVALADTVSNNAVAAWSTSTPHESALLALMIVSETLAVLSDRLEALEVITEDDYDIDGEYF